MKTVIAAVALCVLTACSSSQGGTASSSAGPSGSPLPKASGQLDAQVAMPPSFPGDVPIYPKARLTAAAGFPSSGPTSWGMEWETLDSVAKVQAFYQQGLSKGDWTVTFGASASGGFAATFARKTNNQVNGTLAASTSGGVTRIEMSLLSPPS